MPRFLFPRAHWLAAWTAAATALLPCGPARAAEAAAAEAAKPPAAPLKAPAAPAATASAAIAAKAPARRAEPAPAKAAKATKAVDAAVTAPDDEQLKKLLATRLSGGGEVVIKASEAAPAPTAPRRAPRKAAAEPGEAERLAAAHRAEQAAHLWSHEGEFGPDRWAALSPAFAACASGRRQSPIDIRDGLKVQLDPIQFDYQPSGFRVVDNGHTIQVEVAPGNSIELLGRRYDLVQFHFHKPSEERVNGRQFDMVVHLVHKDLEGRLAVVAVFLTRGTAHPVVQTVWNYLPLERHDDVTAPVALDPAGLLPQDRRYFTYMGSLTTPPCSEGVLWLVLKTPLTVSQEQIAVFSRLYPMNARPVQPSAGRVIKESN